MKKDIAMKCDQKQFNAIEPKLKSMSLFMIEKFEKDFYLVLYQDKSITNGTVICREDYKIYETWNEKIFLEACGIEVEKPIRTNKLTELEKRVEVLEAKINKDDSVITIPGLKHSDFKINILSGNPIPKYNEKYDVSNEIKSILENSKEDKELTKKMSSHAHDAFMKSIKEGKIVIPKTIDVIEELKKYRNPISYGIDFGYHPAIENVKFKRRIEELEAENKAILAGNSVKLEVGKWYKGDKDFNYLIFVTEIEKSIGFNRIHYYGFIHDKNFKEKEYLANTAHEKSLIPATEAEVFEALKNEAVKLGFGPRVYVKNCGDTKEGIFSYHSGFNYLYCGNYSVFLDGKWAEIIPSITKSEAEKQLGKKIID